MANLYGFGRLAWDPNLSAETIAEEWTRLTFGNDPVVVQTVTTMLLASWHTYENYTGPLGAQTLTDILGSHYGPGIESSERNGWGQWHRADHEGIGMDRTVATGTGFAGQYPPAIRDLYESLADYAGRTAAVFSSRSLHLPAAFGQDGDPTHLRFALRGRGAGGGFCAAMEIARNAASDDERYTKTCLPASNIRPGTRSSGAMRFATGFCERLGFRTARAEWEIIPIASRPKPCNSKGTRRWT